MSVGKQDRFCRALLALRDGDISFDDFAAEHADLFRRWAAYFHNRWPRSYVEIEDLIQAGMLECWRCVDYWDPRRGVTIGRYVEYQVGCKMSNELRRVAGWPRKGKPAIPQPQLLDETQIAAVVDRSQDDKPDRLEIGRMIAERLGAGIEADVVAGIMLGADYRVVAAHLYADAEKRFEYRLCSPSLARRRVKKVVKLIVKEGERWQRC